MIVLRPDWRVRVAFSLVLLLAFCGGAYLVSRWGSLELADRLVLTTATLALALWSLDVLQRRWELGPRRIAVRYFFALWSVYTLPPDLRMRPDRRRRLVISDRRGRSVVLPRLYNQNGELEKRLWHLRALSSPDLVASEPVGQSH